MEQIQEESSEKLEDALDNVEDNLDANVGPYSVSVCVTWEIAVFQIKHILHRCQMMYNSCHFHMSGRLQSWNVTI